MLIKKLANLANKLDKLGHINESNEIDSLIKYLVAFIKEKTAEEKEDTKKDKE